MGKTRRGKATRIMAIADGSGLPIAAGIASGQRHEVKLVEATLDAAFLEPLPPRLIGDKAYDSDGLDQQLRVERNIEMIARHPAEAVLRWLLTGEQVHGQPNDEAHQHDQDDD